MSAAIAVYFLIEENTNEKVKRKILRDHNNPLELPESSFIGQYRLNKEAFVMVLDLIESKLGSSSIPPVLQLATALRFLAHGSYQRAVGSESQVSLARSTVSLVLKKMLTVLESCLCSRWVQFSMSANEKRRSRDYFFNKCRIPGITGCIDGTHIKIIKPKVDEHLFFNRKGYFSMNVMIICDGDMKIRAADARYPGSNHDSFIWSVSVAREKMMQEYESGEDVSRLLGDSGYGIELFLITPFRHPRYNSQEYKFNLAHCSGRNIVERTIGVFKSRFRCLMSTLHYEPEKVVQMVNVCCALHNICRSYNIHYNEDEGITEINESLDDNSSSPPSTTMQNEGRRIRAEIAASL